MMKEGEGGDNWKAMFEAEREKLEAEVEKNRVLTMKLQATSSDE
jgi:hypothetical protein